MARSKADTIGNLAENPQPNPNRVKSYSVQDENTGIDGVIKVCQHTNVEKTFERFTVFDMLKKQIPRKLNLQQAIAIIEVVEGVIARSQDKTLTKWPELIGIINNCVENLHMRNYDFSRFRESFPKLMEYVIMKGGFYFGQ
jgi:hypothetical protein